MMIKFSNLLKSMFIYPPCDGTINLRCICCVRQCVTLYFCRQKATNNKRVLIISTTLSNHLQCTIIILINAACVTIPMGCGKYLITSNLVLHHKKCLCVFVDAQTTKYIFSSFRQVKEIAIRGRLFAERGELYVMFRYLGIAIFMVLSCLLYYMHNQLAFINFQLYNYFCTYNKCCILYFKLNLSMYAF